MHMLKAGMKNKIESRVESQLDTVISQVKLNFEQSKTDPNIKQNSLKQLVGMKFLVQMMDKLHQGKANSEFIFKVEKRLIANKFYRIAY